MPHNAGFTATFSNVARTSSLDAERFFEELKKLIGEMDEEERRAAREELTEEELAIFDLLTRPEPRLTKAQEIAVKKTARELLEKLQQHLAVFRWRDFQQTRAAVLAEIRVRLNDLPEEPYPQVMWDQKVDAVWQSSSAAIRGRPRQAL